MHSRINSLDPMERYSLQSITGTYHDVYFSIRDIKFEIDKSLDFSYNIALKEVKSRYKDNPSKQLARKKFQINRLKNKYGAFEIKAIQRALADLIEKGSVTMKGKKYALSDWRLINISGSSNFNNVQLLNSMLKLHTPLINGIEKNVKNLVNIFGSYVFLSLLEIGRPFDDQSYRYITAEPLTPEEKNKFNENLLDKILQTKRMYQIFLETFLNQPDNNMVKNMKELKFLEERNGKYVYLVGNAKNAREYISSKRPSNLTTYLLEDGGEYIPESSEYASKLKSVPLSITPLSFAYSNALKDSSKFYYELDLDTYNYVKNIFSNLCPDVYERFLNALGGSLGGGVKEDLVKGLSEAIS